jgi:hypothetical protein
MQCKNVCASVRIAFWGRARISHQITRLSAQSLSLTDWTLFFFSDSNPPPDTWSEIHHNISILWRIMSCFLGLWKVKGATIPLLFVRGGRIRMPCTHLWWRWIWMTKLIGGYGSMVLKSASCLSGFYDDARMPETCSSKSAGCIGWWWTCQAANMVTLCNLTLALSLRAHTGDWYACDLANTSSGPKVKIRRQLILQLSSVWALQPSHVGLH